MKRIIALLLTLLLALSCAACNSDNGDYEEKDKEREDTVKVQIISKIGDGTNKIAYDDVHHIQRVTMESAELGLLTMELSFNKQGLILSECSIVNAQLAGYDEAEYAEYHFYNSDNFYNYDIYGNRIEENSYLRCYDENGNLRMEMYSDGTEVIYFYDEAGRLIKDGSKTYTYDKNGNLVYWESESGWFMSYQYDAEGRLIAKEGSFWKTYYEYNPDGTVAKFTSITGGQEYVYEFEYQTVSVPKDQVAAIEAERQYIYDNIVTMFW